MRRQDKYPDTKTFHFYNANPKNRFTGDCVYRALTAATGYKWEEMILACAAMAIKSGYSPASKENYGRVLEALGFQKMKQPRKEDGTKYTGKEFCLELAKKNVRYVANIGGNHVVAIVNCKVQDIWNSTDGCIGNYWVKEDAA